MSKALKKEIVEDEPTPVKAVSLSVDEEILDQVRMAVAAAEEKKAENIVALRLSALTEFTDYFIICTGNSTRQTQAIADEVTAQLKKNYRLRPLNTEGYTSAEWILIDFGAFVLHVFTETSRSFYDLERLWRDAEVVRF
ncbi:MAG: ribosome silencing factor [Acidobacteria bacterium]|nr:ribosome silencing factor [Acidobacteriota bacterium]